MSNNSWMSEELVKDWEVYNVEDDEPIIVVRGSQAAALVDAANAADIRNGRSPRYSARKTDTPATVDPGIVGELINDYRYETNAVDDAINEIDCGDYGTT